MKNIYSLIAIVALSAGSAFAGCGKIDTTEGTLKSFDAEAKVAIVETKGGESKRLTLTPDSKGGKKADKLVGQAVTVLSSHGKVTEIAKA